MNSVAHSVLSADLSISSTIVSAPELRDLEQHDIELLDAIIERAGPSASTFLTVFKAYNDILQERGLDTHEVIYYGKLLKLGTLKGGSWADKWEMVKLQHGYGGKYGTPTRKRDPPTQPRSSRTPIRRVIPTTRPSRIDDDSFTLHSHQEDTEYAPSDPDTRVDTPQYRPTINLNRPRPAPLSPSTVTEDSTGSAETNVPSYPIPPTPDPRFVPLAQTRNLRVWDTAASETTETRTVAPSTVPPSYRATLGEPKIQRLRSTSPSPGPSDRPSPSPGIISSTTARQTIALARERRGSIVNEDDAWNKIKMARDEEEADRFRQERLVERCWDVWRQGFQWIIVSLNGVLSYLSYIDAFSRLRTSKSDMHETISSCVAVYNSGEIQTHRIKSFHSG